MFLTSQKEPVCNNGELVRRDKSQRLRDNLGGNGVPGSNSWCPEKTRFLCEVFYLFILLYEMSQCLSSKCHLTFLCISVTCTEIILIIVDFGD